ncbi:MAG: hypothetical protein R3E09_19180 [Novosphingobium sp.]|nr:hypothetical protein [Novosphingobium sp.]
MTIPKKLAGAAAGLALVAGIAAYQPAFAESGEEPEAEAILEISFLLPGIAALVWALDSANDNDNRPVSP